MELGAIWSQCFPEFAAFPQEKREKHEQRVRRDLAALLRKGETEYVSPGVIPRENTFSPS